MSLLLISVLLTQWRPSHSNSENLPPPIQIQLSKKQKTFSQCFSAFLKTAWYFQHVQKKKMTIIAYVFPKSESKEVKKMFKNNSFKTPFDSQHDKGSQTLLKSAPKHFYHIF